jgi:hypothetical protein
MADREAEGGEGVTDIPFRLSRRPLDGRGFVIPFTQFIKPDGTPDFRVMDDERTSKAVRRRLCSLCGEKMRRNVYFVGGPKCVENGFFYDPPMHRECAVYALQACPHLARAKGKYAPVPDRIEGAGLLIQGEMDTEKAEWFGLMQSAGYTSSRTDTGMIVIKADMPWLSVERWRDGSLMAETV